MRWGIRATLVLAAIALASDARQESAAPLSETEPDSGLINGTVIYESGKPVEGATVYAVPLGRPFAAIIPHADTDESGSFSIQIPRSWFGEFGVAAKKEGEDYPDMSERFYNDGKFVRVILTSGRPAQTVVIRLGSKAGVLLGTVADEASGVGLNPCVELRRASEPTNFLSGSGLVKPQYKLLIPPNTDILVTILLDGYKTWYYPGTVDHKGAKPVRLGPGEKRTMDILLTRDAEVKTGCPSSANFPVSRFTGHLRFPSVRWIPAFVKDRLRSECKVCG